MDEFNFLIQGKEVHEKHDTMKIEEFPYQLLLKNLSLQEHTFLARKQYIEMLQYLKQINWPEQDLARFVLWGNFGTGKSVTISQIFHYAYKANYIVINFPRLKSWFSHYNGVCIF